MNSSKAITDHRDKQTLAISSVPANGTSSASATVAPGSYYIFAVVTTPDNQNLSLWNFSWSLYIDANNGANAWPYGSALTATQLTKLVVTSHYDWAASADAVNQRTEYIFIQNNDTVSHTVYLNYKAYTQPGAAAR